MLSALAATLTGLAVVVLAQATPAPGGGEVAWLGVIAGAMVFGAGLAYRYTTLPERMRAAKAETERIAAQDREREAYQVTTPALLSFNSNFAAILERLREKAP